MLLVWRRGKRTHLGESLDGVGQDSFLHIHGNWLQAREAVQHAKNSLVLALFFAEIEIKQVFLKNASRNKLKASGEPGIGMWPNVYDLQHHTLYQGLCQCLPLGVWMLSGSASITWSTISNEMFSLKWTEGMIHFYCFWTQWCQLGCVCWHVMMSEQPGICWPCCLQTLWRTKGCQERQGSPREAWKLRRRSLTKRLDLDPGAALRETKEKPHPCTVSIPCSWPAAPLAAPGHLLKLTWSQQWRWQK